MKAKTTIAAVIVLPLFRVAFCFFLGLFDSRGDRFDDEAGSAYLGDLHVRSRRDLNIGVDGRPPLFGTDLDHPARIEVVDRFEDDRELADISVSTCLGGRLTLPIVSGEALEHCEEHDRDHDERHELDWHGHTHEGEDRCGCRPDREREEEEADRKELTDGEDHRRGDPDPSPLFSVHVCSFRCEDNDNRECDTEQSYGEPKPDRVRSACVSLWCMGSKWVSVGGGPFLGEACEVGADHAVDRLACCGRLGEMICQFVAHLCDLFDRDTGVSPVAGTFGDDLVNAAVSHAHLRSVLSRLPSSAPTIPSTTPRGDLLLHPRSGSTCEEGRFRLLRRNTRRPGPPSGVGRAWGRCCRRSRAEDLDLSVWLPSHIRSLVPRR